MTKAKFSKARYYFRKKKRKRELQESEQDSSAMADLAFLLLIFFIVTSSFILRQGLFLSLPQKNARARKIDESKIVEVVVTKQDYLLAGRNVSRLELLKHLLESKSQSQDGMLSVYMAQNLRYERFIDVMSLARETGFAIQIKNAID